MLLPTGLQNIAPPALRARFIAINGLVNVTFASLAPPLVGLLSDHYSPSYPQALLMSSLAVCCSALVVASLLLRSGERAFASIMQMQEADPAVPVPGAEARTAAA